jgi:hypothetical protein
VGTTADTLQNSDLNKFLHAEIGTEASGMTLSVLSSLARLGIDPWQEAARLARLPRKAAVAALAQTIAGMPASPWPSPNATPIAERLVALLPNGGSASFPEARPRAAPEADLGAWFKSLLSKSSDSSAQRRSPASRTARELVSLVAAAALMLAVLQVITMTHGPLVAAAPSAVTPAAATPAVVPPTGVVPTGQ